MTGVALLKRSETIDIEPYFDTDLPVPLDELPKVAGLEARELVSMAIERFIAGSDLQQEAAPIESVDSSDRRSYPNSTESYKDRHHYGLRLTAAALLISLTGCAGGASVDTRDPLDKKSAVTIGTACKNTQSGEVRKIVGGKVYIKGEEYDRAICQIYRNGWYWRPAHSGFLIR